MVAIVGPTGIGKSRIALRLAQVFSGEIINADSRQIYRYMDIGTAKPSLEELAFIPHHLISILDPDEDFSLAQYQELAYKAIKDIQSSGKLPLLVGGTGQYIWAVLEGWEVPRIPPDMELRHALEKRASENGVDKLYEELVKTDPVAAEKIDRRNVRRVIRALEVSKQALTPFSQLRGKKSPPFNTLIIGLTASREQVYSRVDRRVDEMIRQGLVTEVDKLLKMGYDLSLPSMSSVGYRQIGMFLSGELSFEEAVAKIKTETHRIVRHQYAWFRLADKRIHWFNVEQDTEPEISTLVTEFLSQK